MRYYRQIEARQPWAMTGTGFGTYLRLDYSMNDRAGLDAPDAVPAGSTRVNAVMEEDGVLREYVVGALCWGARL